MLQILHIFKKSTHYTYHTDNNEQFTPKPEVLCILWTFNLMKRKMFFKNKPDHFRCDFPNSIKQRMVKSPLETLTLKTQWSGHTSGVLLVKFPWIPWNTHKKCHWDSAEQNYGTAETRCETSLVTFSFNSMLCCFYRTTKTQSLPHTQRYACTGDTSDLTQCVLQHDKTNWPLMRFWDDIYT